MPMEKFSPSIAYTSKIGGSCSKTRASSMAGINIIDLNHESIITLNCNITNRSQQCVKACAFTSIVYHVLNKMNMYELPMLRG